MATKQKIHLKLITAKSAMFSSRKIILKSHVAGKLISKFTIVI